MKTFILLIATFLFSFSSQVYSASISVQGLQAPAWVERDGNKEPISVDTQLEKQDIVTTGSSGKIWLSMEDGAVIKLGNQAKMKVESISVSTDPASQSNAIEAGLEILVGAFRYTTSQLESQISKNWQRQVDIKLAPTATIGIRGTDLWGQVGSENQFVVLLEGTINISTDTSGSTPVVLDQALQIFKMENRQALPVSTVDMSAVQALAPETELDFGLGVQQADGAYQINLASTQSQSAAKRLVKSLHKRGYSAQVKESEINGEAWLRIMLTHIVSVEDAKNLAANLRDELNITSPWVQKM